MSENPDYVSSSFDGFGAGELEIIVRALRSMRPLNPSEVGLIKDLRGEASEALDRARIWAAQDSWGGE